MSPADTIEGNLEPEAAETAAGHEHEGHDHAGLDHEGHDHAAHDHEGHNHGPVLNPECTREIVLDIPADEVSKAFSSVAANYRKYAKIPGFRAGKVPEIGGPPPLCGAEIRKEVIDSLLPERFNKAVVDLGVKPVGQPQVTELTVEDGAPLHVKAVFEYIPDFSIEGYQSVTVDKPSVEVTEEEFQQEIEPAPRVARHRRAG